MHLTLQGDLMKNIGIVAVVLATLFMNGCVKTQMYTPEVSANNKYFTASIEPLKSVTGGYEGFILHVNSRTNTDIEIDWNKTLFVENGVTKGTFMYDGIVYTQRNNNKAPDYIFAKSNYSKAIYPNNKVYFAKGWHHEDFDTGRLGIVLSTTINDKIIREKLFINVSDVKK